MAFHLSPEEHQKVQDAWKPSYTDAQFKAFCYLLDHAEDTSIRRDLGPSLDRYSPENIWDMITEARFLVAVQCAVSDFAQDSHRARKEGPEFTIPDFWDNIKELGYPSEHFWTDLQVTIRDLHRKAWYTVARLYDINEKPTPEEEERSKELRDGLKKAFDLPLDVPVSETAWKSAVDKDFEEAVQRHKEQEERLNKTIQDLEIQLQKSQQQLKEIAQQEQQQDKASKSWLKKAVSLW